MFTKKSSGLFCSPAHYDSGQALPCPDNSFLLLLPILYSAGLVWHNRFIFFLIPNSHFHASAIEYKCLHTSLKSLFAQPNAYNICAESASPKTPGEGYKICQIC